MNFYNHFIWTLILSLGSNNYNDRINSEKILIDQINNVYELKLLNINCYTDLESKRRLNNISEQVWIKRMEYWACKATLEEFPELNKFGINGYVMDKWYYDYYIEQTQKKVFEENIDPELMKCLAAKLVYDNFYDLYKNYNYSHLYNTNFLLNFTIQLDKIKYEDKVK